MATLNVYWYGRGIEALKNGEINWATDGIKVALLTSAYTPNQGNDTLFDNISQHEATGSGYTTGGATLTGKSQTYDPNSVAVTFEGDDISWDPSSITARYAIIYRELDGRLIGYGDAGSDQTSDGAAFTVEWHPDGILRGSAATP